jgi:hypothetical protein
MYQSSPDLSGWFRLEGKSREIFYVIIPTKLCSLNFGFGGLAGGASPAAPPPSLGTPLVFLMEKDGIEDRFL